MFDIFTPQALKVSVAHLSAQLIQNPLVHAFDTGHGSRISESLGFVLLLCVLAFGVMMLRCFGGGRVYPACFMGHYVPTMLMLRGTTVSDCVGC
jgi:hypothetical protein